MRKNGFFVRVDLFIPADMKDRDKARQVMDAIDLIEQGEPGDALEIGIVLKVDSKFTSRDIPDREEPVQLDIEDADLTGEQEEALGEHLSETFEARAEDGEDLRDPETLAKRTRRSRAA